MAYGAIGSSCQDPEPHTQTNSVKVMRFSWLLRLLIAQAGKLCVMSAELLGGRDVTIKDKGRGGRK